jgi:DNA polymerase-3 subunit alpha
MIYQEQVMAAARVLAGYTLGGADLLRRAMGKKDKEKMAKEREKFIKGSKKLNDIDEKKANEIFDLLEKFAGYGFNKSHSVAYGWISYQTAFLKANFPVDFMAAVLSNEYSNTEKISVFVGECQRMGIEILPPDVNRSGPKFSPEIDREKMGIRYGLAAIKNVGEGAMLAAIEEREKNAAFKSLEDFCKRLDPRKINKKVLESLVKCGAFDFTGRDRAELFATVDNALAMSASAHRDRESGQVSLFDVLAEHDEPPRPAKIVAVPPWSQSEKLAFEKELLGFYVTGHPLDEYRSVLESGKFASIVSLGELEDKSQVKIGGALTSVEKKFAKKDGRPFAIVVIEDLTGQIEAPVWSEAFAKFGSLLETGKVVSITGKLDKREEPPRISVSEIALLKPGPAAKPLLLSFPCGQTTENDLLEVRDTLLQFPGTQPVMLEFVDVEGRRLRVFPGSDFRVDATPVLSGKLARWMNGRASHK